MPNAPDDLLAPKAADLIAWLEKEAMWRERNGDAASSDAIDDAVRAAQRVVARRYRAVITLLRERDEMAREIDRYAREYIASDLSAESPDAFADSVRETIAKLHTTEA